MRINNEYLLFTHLRPAGNWLSICSGLGWACLHFELGGWVTGTTLLCSIYLLFFIRLSQLCSYVSGRGTGEGKTDHPTIFQASAWITFANILLVQNKITWLSSESKGEAECSTHSGKAMQNYMAKCMETGRGEELKLFFCNANLPGDR